MGPSWFCVLKEWIDETNSINNLILDKAALLAGESEMGICSRSFR